VSWDEFEAFYRETASEGRTDTQALSAEKIEKNSLPRESGRPGAVPLSGDAGELEVDALSGATPPYGTPDQGWGRGARPAITMTHLQAVTYCRWLSLKTGRKYRLPTEAEWEYACRGGTEGAYFFGGDPEDYAGDGWWNRLFGADTEVLAAHAVYAENSGGKTRLPAEVKPNPFGLVNMCGNVWEFCRDWYAPDTYEGYARNAPVTDPSGPARGEAHVIRGGSFKSGAADLRSAARGRTRTDAWLLTDPQVPKSIWWYSDCIDVGFRVVCEYEKPE
jgi:formylglycine-generating enzyme required for sulfatase activity